MLIEKKDLIEALGEKLLEKETINLPDIIDVLGERPFGMNETMKEYLVELRERDAKDAAEKMEEVIEEQAVEDSLADEVNEEIDAAEAKLNSDLESSDTKSSEENKNKDDK